MEYVFNQMDEIFHFIFTLFKYICLQVRNIEIFFLPFIGVMNKKLCGANG